ncbi:hypothetical protein N1031_19945 [Herbiconiux moechotypicola]|uniref:Uncharacterized protein n=1 Tax=Herbiconiux moechotypicola TaxID=637393 RepID=A0ABP5R305_9MICO|nr:hypothetical protein [Herbiconiux moechotypicola]MCS5732033.1 hypothetical protein [Herbiconiux moechotypicola]
MTVRIRAAASRVLLLGAAGALAVALTGCSFSAGTELGVDEPVVDEPLVDEPAVAADDGAGAEEPLGDVPEECLAVSVTSWPGADLADVESIPASWPQPPSGSVLCSTGGGGSTETAAYASPLAIDEILAHYESSLGSEYSFERFSGEENGTGYDSLDGSGPGVGFQVRENDGGFTLVFATDGF